MNRLTLFKRVSPRKATLASRLTTEAVKALQVMHNEGDCQFYITLGRAKAVLDYEFLNPKTVHLRHTEVPSNLQGKGVAKRLAEAAFDFVVDNNLQMKVSCTYLQKYLRENPNEVYSKRTVE